MTNPELTAHLHGQTDDLARNASLLALNDQQPCLSDLPLADTTPQPEQQLSTEQAKTPEQIRAEWEAIEAKRSESRFDTLLAALLTLDAEGKTTELESRLISVVNTLNGAVGSYHVEMAILLDAHAATRTELDRLLADSPTPQPELSEFYPGDLVRVVGNMAGEEDLRGCDGVLLDSQTWWADTVTPEFPLLFIMPSDLQFEARLVAPAELELVEGGQARALAEAHAATQTENARLRAALAEAEAREWRLLQARDEAREAADRLAYACFSVEEIGEHTNLNCPWANAAERLEALAAAQGEQGGA